MTQDEMRTLLQSRGVHFQESPVQDGMRFRCTTNGEIFNVFDTGKISIQGKQSPLSEEIRQAAGGSATAQQATASPSAVAVASSSSATTVFVVHGHDEAAREQLERCLLLLGLDPFVLANTGGGGLTIIEALENEIGPDANHIRFGIVLLTPDDMGYAKADGHDKVEPRARQNVVMEMGMLISALGRPNVAILKKGHLEVPSDASGIIYIPFNSHVKETMPRLCDRLGRAGFQLGPEEITRAST